MDSKKTDLKKYDVGRFSMQDVFDQVPLELTTITNDTDYEFESVLTTDEFSSYCPWTGHPDYATVHIHATIPPGEKIIEQKALRDWLNLFRSVDAYQEEITMAIKHMYLHNCPTADIDVAVSWKGRGGISNVVNC